MDASRARVARTASRPSRLAPLSSRRADRGVARVRGKRRSIKGLELTYGATGPLSTTIDELLRPDDPRGWKHIPAGSVQIQMGQESIDKGGSHALWTGQLKKEGLYITISTPKGERVLLELARALHRGRK